MHIFWTPAKGYGSRGDFRVDWIFIHYTAGKYPSDLNYLARSPKPACPSCHFYIRKNGDVHWMVRLENAAWHAGITWSRPYTWQWERWRALRTNERSVGIEIENLGNEVFTQEQYQALGMLIPTLCYKYGLPIATMPDPWLGCNHKERADFYPIEELNEFRGLLAHGNTHKSKVDPGILFEWDRIKSLEPIPDPGCLNLIQHVITFGDPKVFEKGMAYA